MNPLSEIPIWSSPAYTGYQPINASAVQVAAAMVAVVAEAPVGYVSQASELVSRSKGSCIQGAMLAKLGYPFEEGRVYGGATGTVLGMLGLEYRTRETERLADALALAQDANDFRLPWSAALEAFEAVMAGEEYEAVQDRVDAARQGLAELRDRNRPEPIPPADFVPSWYSAKFQQNVDAEMAAMKKLLEQINQQNVDAEMAAMKKLLEQISQPIEPIVPKYVTFPVVKKDSSEGFAVLKELSTV